MKRELPIARLQIQRGENGGPRQPILNLIWKRQWVSIFDSVLVESRIVNAETNFTCLLLGVYLHRLLLSSIIPSANMSLISFSPSCLYSAEIRRGGTLIGGPNVGIKWCVRLVTPGTFPERGLCSCLITRETFYLH